MAPLAHTWFGGLRNTGGLAGWVWLGVSHEVAGRQYLELEQLGARAAGGWLGNSLSVVSGSGWLSSLHGLVWALGHLDHLRVSCRLKGWYSSEQRQELPSLFWPSLESQAASLPRIPNRMLQVFQVSHKSAQSKGEEKRKTRPHFMMSRESREHCR